ncbi:extracellular solute-binding protein [Litoreibacter arenae]|uniref:ABC transporter, periplasmic spermidine putrescine-binding protein PotD n=1 Tax=Litoreibacter arenae DSM 19593 TaxID=1123360 RepID=S9S202_9RHOB|nr:extracellular solute-binding protein [Litoreibacter arenae]EPX80234.1 ABC transporter, periplasmic spermidine putrescine-binding protein PotD [Litoreibacter arenae DSM 19593]
MTRLTKLLGTSAAALTATAALAADPELLVFDYSGFENPDFHIPYSAAHGDSPTFAFFGDEEEAFQKIVSGFQTDVTHVCSGSVNKWIEAGIVEPWDVSKIPAITDIDATLMGQEVTETSEVYFVPTDFGTTAIAYNPDEISAETVSTLDVFLSPEYAGRLSIPDNVDDAYALAYLATGTSDWTNASDEQFEAASDWLRQAHGNLRTYWTDPAELSQLMASGEVLISWAWNETYPTMKEEGRPIAFERSPKEGSSVWLCGYVNMKDAQGSEDKAYDYINAILAPETTEALLSQGFGHANAAALASISAEELDAAGLGEASGPLLAQLPMSRELRDKQSEAFERIQAGF